MFIRHSANLNLKLFRRKPRNNDFLYFSCAANRELASKNGNESRTGSQASSTFFNHVRHSHKMIDVYNLKLPHKYWGWWQRLFMWRYFKRDFNKEDFFTGVIVSFVFVSQCIAKDKTSQLYGVLTDEAMEDVPLYSTHAKDDINTFTVDEKDIVYLHVKSSRIHTMVEFEHLRNVQVLTLGVWITYVKDFQKKLEAKEIMLEEPMSKHMSAVRDVMKDFLTDNRIAIFQFQRVYDQSLKNPLSDWKVSRIYYQIPDIQQ